jgi:4-amino-4-deoxy-L-arabinose transferase-like glycosyltransferase
VSDEAPESTPSVPDGSKGAVTSDGGGVRTTGQLMETAPRGGFAERLDGLLLLLWRGLSSRHFTWLLLLLTATAYLSLVTGKLRENSDSVVYLRLAENLASGRGYSYQGQPHATFVPGWPLILSAAMKLGASRTWHLNLFVALLGLGMCWAVWTLTRLLTGPGLANVAVIAFAFGENTMKWAQRPLSEVAFTLAFLLALIAVTMAWRQERLSLPWGLGAALLGAGATMIRPTGAILFPAFFAWLWVTVPRKAGKAQRCALAAAFCVCGLVPPLSWTAWAVRHHDAYRPSYVNATSKGLRRPAARLARAAAKTGRIFAALSENLVGHYTAREVGSFWAVSARTLLLLLAAGGTALALWRRHWLLPGVIFCALVLTALFTRPLPRYVFPVHAPLIIMALLAVAALVRRFRLVVGSACLVMFVGLLALSLVACGRTRKNRNKPERNQPYRQLTAWLEARPDGREPRVCSWQARRIHYFSGLPAHRSKGGQRGFPGTWCHYGGFDLVVLERRRLDPDKKMDGAILNHDGAVREGARRMAKWGLIRIVPEKMPGLDRFEVWRLVSH